MTPEERQLQLLSITATDHEIIARGIACFRRVMGGDHSAVAITEFQAVKSLLRETLPAHFAHEDRQLFPALLAAQPPPPVAARLTALTHEHTTLLQEARRLSDLLGQLTPSECTGILWMALFDFLNSLEKHSSNEDLLLLELLEK